LQGAAIAAPGLLKDRIGHRNPMPIGAIASRGTLLDRFLYEDLAGGRQDGPNGPGWSRLSVTSLRTKAQEF
jgi:hypothetical protein